MSLRRGGFDISPCECRVLSVLSRAKQGMWPKEVYRELDISRGTLSVMIARLRELGYIEEVRYAPVDHKHRDIVERRAYVITPLGRIARVNFAIHLGFGSVR